MARRTGFGTNPFLNRSQLAQLQLQERTTAREQDFAFRRELLALFQNQQGTTQNLPSEFGRNIGLFQPGGQFGEGGRAEVRRGSEQALAAGHIALGSTGMSSGTNVAGLGARVSADEALANKRIEDERVARLSGALTQAGGARLESREQLLRLLRSI